MGVRELMRDLRFAAGIATERPFQVLVQVTNRCNMKCSFCDFWPNGVPAAQELTTEDFARVADELAELGCFLVSIEGGEPFVRPDLLEIVRAFGRKHVPVLYTNGWFLKDRDEARRFFDAGLAHVGVSIDYPDAARHDAKRGLQGAWSRAVAAVEVFRDAAPHGERNVHIMSVVMRSNQDDLERLLQLSARLGVGHCLTLLSTMGFRRGESNADELPDAHAAARLPELWDRHRHLRVFREYVELMEPFVAGQDMPTCRAGVQSFNLDHVGNVSPCIEKIDRVVGNVRREPLAAIVARMKDLDEVKHCQACWTLCRGFNQAMGARGKAGGWRDLMSRMRA
jgi:MoaA/NifB/PqqE/SkfB family radical SAM enzyme